MRHEQIIEEIEQQLGDVFNIIITTRREHGGNGFVTQITATGVGDNDDIVGRGASIDHAKYAFWKQAFIQAKLMSI